MLVEDFKTVAGIFRKKRMVRRYLQETAAWCLPGDWHIEGPYARHSAVELPEELEQAIRGIRRRQRSREIVERLLPPWRAKLHASAARHAHRCSIAYLSNGGNWKLFDLDNRTICTRPIIDRDVTPEIENLRRFGGHFNIPEWRTAHQDGRLWRFDRYIGGRSLARCTEDERLDAVRVLLQQFAAFAGSCAGAPDPALTDAAIRTMLESAPGSVPACAAQRHVTELRRLGETLPLVPSHGDLNAHNVFLHDAAPWIIDWDSAGRREPMLYDVLYLIVLDVVFGRMDLFRALLAGRLDAQIEAALAANGLPQPDCSRLLLLLHAYLISFHRKRLARQRDADAGNVEALWTPLRAHFAGIDS